MFRQLPPTASPLIVSDLARGLAGGSQRKEALGRFSRVLAATLDVPACYLASSGRTALYLLLRALTHEPSLAGRREIVLPAYTCPAVAKVALDVGLQPRLVDVSPSSLGFDVDRLAAAIGKQTLAVVHVHPFGLPQPVDAVLDLAHLAGAVVIEDAAQSMGARSAGRPVGVRGDFGLYSLGPGKPLSLGGGGVLSVNGSRYGDLVAEAWKTLPDVGAAGSALAEARLAAFALAFHPRGWWLITRTGLNSVGDREESWGYRLAGLAPSQAAVGLALLPKLDEANRQRRHNAELLLARLAGLDGVCLLVVDPTAEPIYLRLPVLVPDEARHKEIYRRLWAAGIGVGRMYQRPLSAIFPQIPSDGNPGAELVARSLLTLPTHHYLTDADVECIVDMFSVVG